MIRRYRNNGKTISPDHFNDITKRNEKQIGTPYNGSNVLAY